MNTIKVAVTFAALLVCGLILPSSLQAQQTIEKGAFEVAGSIGLSGGVDLMHLIGGLDNKIGEPRGTKWNVGATASFAIRSNLLVVGEFTRTNLFNPSTVLTPSPFLTPLELSAHLLELTGGLQYQIPLKNSKIIPFVGAGLGAARTRERVTVLDSNVSDINVDDDLIGNLGGGARIHLSSRWGVRPELKFVATSDGAKWVRTAVGVFYQFGR